MLVLRFSYKPSCDFCSFTKGASLIIFSIFPFQFVFQFLKFRNPRLGFYFEVEWLIVPVLCCVSVANLRRFSPAGIDVTSLTGLFMSGKRVSPV